MLARALEPACLPRTSGQGANLRIQNAAIERVRAAANASSAALSGRLARLRREWDMERTLEFNASLAAGVGAWGWLVVGVWLAGGPTALQCAAWPSALFERCR